MTQPTIHAQTRVTETTSWLFTEEQVTAIIRQHLGADEDARVDFNISHGWLLSVSVVQKKVTES